ncbi:hypothetical protein [Aurantiacibacter sp. D1-12]|uniref:hypothetical protein n=1 Tax=Aurantiacibacter sp. D1-12 TaxID=2993658 RepID=UPI00237CC98B|nr:hypothetical protein [Aurantiacibacter sp. D1-12]MDE1468179.1 hypothetical protein [Aurantiacibacter sp. D1-12]
MTRFFALSAASAIALALPAMPAAAQDQGGDRVNQIIVYGDDPCPVSTEEEITVCARLDESERYRIPPTLRNSNSRENETWDSRFKSLEAVGAFGPLSCTPVGSGAEHGCTMEMIEQAYAERAAGRDVRMSELVNAAREDRLSTIDVDAAMTQERVEELEQAELERRRLAQGQPIEGEEPLPAVTVDPDAIPEDPPAVPQTRDDY